MKNAEQLKKQILASIRESNIIELKNSIEELYKSDELDTLELLDFTENEMMDACIAMNDSKIIDFLTNYNSSIISHNIRNAVAKSGYNLEILVNDEEPIVRCSVADSAYKQKRYDLLSKLLNDEDREVRCRIAVLGYGLNKLISDEDYYVRTAVDVYLKEHNLTLDEWKNGK